MKSILLPLFLLVSTGLSGQVVTCDPVMPTADHQVIITFHADRGNKGLINYTGNDVYAHTGVITASSSGWKYVKAEWTSNIAACKLTKISANEYQLTITPDIRQFYGVPANEKILKMAFVFRNSTGSKTGRDAGDADIFADVYEEGLQASFISPSSRFSFVGDDHVFDVEAVSNDADSVFLLIDGLIAKKTDSTAIDTSLLVEDNNRHEIIILARKDDQLASDTIWYMLPGDFRIEAMPQDVRDGISYPADDSAVFCLFAPGKNRIYLIGDFNDWLPDSQWQLKKDGDKFWLSAGHLTPGKEYAFQYIIDEQLRIADPYSEKILDPANDKAISDTVYPGLMKYPEGKTNQITGVIQPGKPAYDWSDDSFVPPQPSRLTIFELLIRDFVSTHDIKDVKGKLDYLQKLGINAIELMPFNEFEDNDSWGYNPSFYFAPDKYYGRDIDFKDFIKECHNRGIAVIMDIVLNHSYYQSPLVRMYYSSATGKTTADNPWYNIISPNSSFSWGFDFNHESPATQYFVDRVIEYWLTEYKIDGFRFDFTKGFTNTIGDGSAYDASRITILKRIYDKVKTVNQNAYMICEHFAPNSEEQILSSYGILLWGNINYNYNEATMGYLGNSDFSWASYKARDWTTPGLVSYMESHDEERLMFKNLAYGNKQGDYDIKDQATALKRMELAGAFFFTIPGPKMIWQFGELGYEVSIDENGRVGKKPIRWEYTQNPDREHLYLIWAKLIDLRNKYPVFQTDDFSMSVDNNAAAKKIILRHPDGDAIVIGNFGVSATEVIPAFTQTGWWHEVFTGDSINVTDVSAKLTLSAGEYRIYTSQKMESVINDVHNHILESTFFFPNPVTNYLYLRSDIDSIDIFNISGIKIRSVSHITEAGSVDLTGMPEGFYILKAHSGKRMYTASFVKSH